jgi:hypothetical protein
LSLKIRVELGEVDDMEAYVRGEITSLQYLAGSSITEEIVGEE